MGSDGNRNPLRGDSDGAQTFRERRRRSDGLVKGAVIMSFVSWIVLFAVWIVLYFAGFTGNYGNTPINLITNNPVSHTYTYTLLPIAYALLLFSLASCLIAFLFSRMRMRRKTDRYRKSIFITGGVTIIALIAFLINYGSYFLW